MKIDAKVHFGNYNKLRDTWITGDMDILQRDFYLLWPYRQIKAKWESRFKSVSNQQHAH